MRFLIIRKVLLSKGRLRQLREKKRPREDLVIVFNYLKRTEHRTRILSYSKRERGICHKLQEGKFQLDIWKK